MTATEPKNEPFESRLREKIHEKAELNGSPQRKFRDRRWKFTLENKESKACCWFQREPKRVYVRFRTQIIRAQLEI